MKGIERAVAQFGAPRECLKTYPVTEGTRRSVRRDRDAEVVILVRRRNGRFLVHTKAFYPQGVYRLPSGGIEPGEDILAALEREAYEETGLDLSIERFLGIIRYHFVRRGRVVPFVSYIFGLVEVGGTLGAIDSEEAIVGYREVTLSEIVDLADQLESLSPDWLAWGRFRAAAHRFVVEILGEQDD